MSRYFIFIPNLLSITRIGLVYPILNNIYLNNFQVSIVFFIAAAITDALDGFLARRMDWQTDLGTILDPIADKLLLSGTIFMTNSAKSGCPVSGQRHVNSGISIVMR